MYLNEEGHQRQQEGVVDLAKTLNLIPLICYKVSSPDANWGRVKGRRGSTSIRGLIG